MKQIVVHLIAAARPNFMKVAPLYHALRGEAWCEPLIVHTGQHYDPQMSDAFFRDLELPAPHIHLGVGSGTHAEQTGRVMIAYEKVCLERRPDWIVVVGDVNSTLAGALVGTKLGIPVVHLEAGLRSRDRSMPEEINRLATDAIADVLWTPSRDGDENLLAEGIPASRIDFIGNVMIDSYELMRPKIAADGTRGRLGLTAGEYGVVTLHRPVNVDNEASLRLLVEQLIRAAAKLKLVFAVHPRTRKRLGEFGLDVAIAAVPRLIVTEPLPYISFMNLVSGARLVLTDSGGVQEETSYLGIPCLTARESTERPITVTNGTNRLVHLADVGRALDEVLTAPPASRRPIELWDGQAAARATAALRRRCGAD